MRIATYNVEWFNSLFSADDRLLPDNHWSGRQDVRRGQQIDALGLVFDRLDADLVMIVEAPDGNGKRDTARALERFAARFGIRARRALCGFANDTQQELALLYDPDVVTAAHDPRGGPAGLQAAGEAPRFDTAFRWDLDVDANPEVVTFSKPPLEAALTLAGGRLLRLIGVHIKSKAPHGARSRADVTRLSIENRRKQLAQCIWLRKRVEVHLGRGESLVVLGDFNDGPGLDQYEQLFGRSGVEIVIGENGAARLFDPHAQMALTRRIGAQPTTSRFYIAEEKRFLQALLDYIMVSPDLAALSPVWRIWHPFEDARCYGDAVLREALLTASDHFPVTMDIAL